MQAGDTALFVEGKSKMAKYGAPASSQALIWHYDNLYTFAVLNFILWDDHVGLLVLSLTSVDM